MKRLMILAVFVVGCIEPTPTPKPTPTSHYYVIGSTQQ